MNKNATTYSHVMTSLSIHPHKQTDISTRSTVYDKYGRHTDCDTDAASTVDS
jgi:hypothetical protein